MEKSSQVSIGPAGKMDDLVIVSNDQWVKLQLDSLAAEVSTLGGGPRPGFKWPGPFVGFCLYGILSKFPYESGGGVARVKLASVILLS